MQFIQLIQLIQCIHAIHTTITTHFVQSITFMPVYSCNSYILVPFVLLLFIQCMHTIHTTIITCFVHTTHYVHTVPVKLVFYIQGGVGCGVRVTPRSYFRMPPYFSLSMSRCLYCSCPFPPQYFPPIIFYVVVPCLLFHATLERSLYSAGCPL